MSDSPFPSRDEIDWSVLDDLDRPHPLVNNQWQPPHVEGDPGWIIELFYTMRNVHHLLDLADVPHGYSLDTRSIDCRVLLLVRAYLKLRESVTPLG